MSKKAHVSDKKKEVVKRLQKLIKENSIIGLLDMENLPARQLQIMKEKLRGDVILLLSKKRLIKVAIDKVKDDKKGIEKLLEHFKGMPALLFTDKNPFELFKIIKKNKSGAPAKAGQIAPADISVKEGATPFAPGPVIGELGAIGIKTKIEDNKIHITESSVVVKEGEEIKANVAGILTRLGIKPIEVGLDLVAVYENGDILTKDILDIDEEKYLNDLKFAHSEAYKLALETVYPIKEVIEAVLGKIHNESKMLALEQNILTDETAEEILKKAENEAKGLKQKVPESSEKPVDTVEEKKDEIVEKEKKEEPNAEEKVETEDGEDEKEVKEETDGDVEKKEVVEEKKVKEGAEKPTPEEKKE